MSHNYYKAREQSQNTSAGLGGYAAGILMFGALVWGVVRLLTIVFNYMSHFFLSYHP